MRQSMSQSSRDLFFLAAYPTRKLQTLPVLSLYGSEDGVLNMEKYQEAIGLAADCREYVLEGGNHAGFGNYGSQKGDGEAGLRTGSSGRKRSITSWT